MESGAFKLIESATHRTLHAHSFSRSSSQASFVLSDLLSRYLTLLSTTCVKYAQHAGRNGLTARDALCALDELGLSVEELKEYCASEGVEMGRYALHSARRAEDLNEFKAQLTEGLRQDHNDSIPLQYMLLSTLPSEEGSKDEYGEKIAEDTFSPDAVVQDGMDLDMPLSQTELETCGSDSSHRPPLPLSPISNPSSPRKRPRTSKWQPPSHVPDFMPPFPSQTDTRGETRSTGSPTPVFLPPLQPHPIKIEKPPSPLPQPIAPTSASDYLTPIPYSQSSLATVPQWHLPSDASTLPNSIPTRGLRLATPQTQPSLITAYHYILTHPPPPNATSANPSRHKVAMALLSQTQTNSRWDPPDTLYSSIAPCQPRVAAIGPTYPVPQGKIPSTPLDSKPSKLDERDRDAKLPTAPPRPVSTNERLTSLISHQTSRIPELARHVLPATVHNRTSRLTHPPVLMRGTEKVLYGNGVPAPWNANVTPAAGAAVPSTPIGSKVSKDTIGLPNGKGKETPPIKAVIQDARLFATWDYEVKSFKDQTGPARRGRVGSIQSGSGVRLSLGIGGRGRSASKMG